MESTEKKRQYRRKWRAANPEKVRETKRRLYAANREKEKAARRRRYAANGHNQRKKVREANGCIDATGDTKHGPCEICGKACNLCYDHNHATGEFRGWLCSHCNLILGHYEKWYLNNQQSIKHYLGDNDKQ